MRSGAFAPSHCPTMPPSERPQNETRSTPSSSSNPSSAARCRRRRCDRPARASARGRAGRRAGRDTACANDGTCASHIAVVVPRPPESTSTGASSAPSSVYASVTASPGNRSSARSTKTSAGAEVRRVAVRRENAAARRASRARRTASSLMFARMRSACDLEPVETVADRRRAPPASASASDSAFHSACQAPAARSMLVLALRQHAHLCVHAARARTREHRPCRIPLVRHRRGLPSRRLRDFAHLRLREQDDVEPDLRRRRRDRSERARQLGNASAVRVPRQCGLGEPELLCEEARYLRPAGPEHRERSGCAAELRRERQSAEARARVEHSDEPAGCLQPERRRHRLLQERARRHRGVRDAPPRAARMPRQPRRARRRSDRERSARRASLRCPGRPGSSRRRAPSVRCRLRHARAAHGRAALRDCRQHGPRRTAARRRRARDRTARRSRPLLPPERSPRLPQRSPAPARRRPWRRATLRPRPPHEEAPARTAPRTWSMSEEHGRRIALHGDIEQQVGALSPGRPASARTLRPARTARGRPRSPPARRESRSASADAGAARARTRRRRSGAHDRPRRPASPRRRSSAPRRRCRCGPNGARPHPRPRPCRRRSARPPVDQARR